MIVCKATLLCLFSLVVNGVSSDELKMVMEGDSVTLQTDLTELQTDHHIQWRFNKSLIAKIIKEFNSSSISDTDDGRFRDKLKLDSQTGSLTITNITDTNSGLYNLQISNNKGASDKRFNVTVYAHLSVPKITRDCKSSTLNCSLTCSAMNVAHATLSWYKGNSLLSSISESDLSIRLSLPLEVEYQDTNTYSCVLNNPITNQTQHLNITELCQPCSENHENKRVGIGLAVVVTVFVFVTVFVVVRCYKKWKNQRKGNECEVVETLPKDEVLYTDITFVKEDPQKKTLCETEAIYSSVKT